MLASVYCCGLIATGLAGPASYVGLLRFAKVSSTRRYVLSLLAMIIPLIVMSGIILGSAAAGYDGNCYGFTDGVAACNFEEYLSIQIQWLFILMIPAAMVVGVVGFLTLLLHKLSEV